MKHFLLNLTWQCPNRCPYCWMRKTVALRPELYDAPTRPLADWVAAIHRDKPELVDIAGGEPLLVEWLPELMSACPSTYFGVSTNGLISDGVLRLCKAQPQNIVAINVSYHPDASARWVWYDARWQWAVSVLRQAGFRVHVNVVDYANNVARSQAALGWLNAQSIPHEVSPYEEVAGLGGYRSLGLVCKGGINHLTVGPDGMAWPCLTVLRSPYWEELVLGNWLDGTIDLTRKPVPCYLDCADYYILPSQHVAGDMWCIEARPWGETA